MNRLRMFFKIATLMFVTSSTVAFILYFGMQAILGHPPIIVAVPLAHVTQYQNQYPVPYLLTVAFVFALVGTFWLTAIMPRRSRFRRLQMAVVPFFAVLLTGPIWGMLWVYHDMQAGFFPDFPRMMEYLLFGAQQGLFFAFNGAVFSFPLNILAYAVAYILLLVFSRWFVSEQSKNISLVRAGG